MTTEGASGSSHLHLPPHIFADTSKLKSKKEGIIVLSSSVDGSEKLEISGKLAKTSIITKLMKGISRESDTPKFAKLKESKGVVVLNLQNQNKKMVKVCVKTEDLARVLGVDTEKIEKLNKAGVLGEFARGRMQGKLLEKKEETAKPTTESSKDSSSEEYSTSSSEEYSTSSSEEFSSTESTEESSYSEEDSYSREEKTSFQANQNRPDMGLLDELDDDLDALMKTESNRTLASTKGSNVVDMRTILKPEHREAINKFYETENSDSGVFDVLTEPTLIHRDEAKLPYSIVYVPDGPGKGMYVLLKTHEGHKEVGVGGFHRATLAIKWDTGERKVFRNAKSSDVPENEIDANEKLLGDSHFSTGIPVRYQGVYRPRESREKNIDLDKDERYQRLVGVHDKVGFITDYEEGGDLFARVYESEGSLPELSGEQLGTMAQEYTKTIVTLHENGLTHNDQKLENVLLTKDEHIKLSDLGFAVPPGGKVPGGTNGYIAPEIAAKLDNRENGEASFKADIWQMGCVFAALYGRRADWIEWCATQDWTNIDPGYFENTVVAFFDNWENPSHPDFIIAQCLMLNPDERPTAQEVFAMWDNFNKTGSAE